VNLFADDAHKGAAAWGRPVGSLHDHFERVQPFSQIGRNTVRRCEIRLRPIKGCSEIGATGTTGDTGIRRFHIGFAFKLLLMELKRLFLMQGSGTL